ncbi:hypothetical protein OUZ56_009821 [Daphnia magna]|uniref:GMP synthase n=1 Tax=Daphnia magna TaxID=35525 RepID=A0ABR0AH42_9CRUS|nr:hypothetical protein OUZ56_009821 [Daphnia magna]
MSFKSSNEGASADPHRYKKGDKSRRHFVDSRQESASLCHAIQSIPRNAPYINFHGSTIHVVLEGQPYLRVQTSTDGQVALMVLYYVFDLKYSEEVKPTLLFLQQSILNNESAG